MRVLLLDVRVREQQIGHRERLLREIRHIERRIGAAACIELVAARRRAQLILPERQLQARRDDVIS